MTDEATKLRAVAELATKLLAAAERHRTAFKAVVDGATTIAQSITSDREAVTQLLATMGVNHRWAGTVLEIQKPDGTFAAGVDLRGRSAEFRAGPTGLEYRPVGTTEAWQTVSTFADALKAFSDSAAASAAQAAASAGVAGSGPATTLLYPALQKVLAAATDIVDVFIYDTRRDSDGGEWTTKCSGTSWYQEALNTATRGAKRDFPKIAAIVLRNNVSSSVPALVIYDLTDFDIATGVPRHWMTFFAAGNNALRQTGTIGTNINLTSVFAVNGRIYVGGGMAGGSGVGGLSILDFPNDTANYVASSFWGQYPLGLALRNANTLAWSGNGGGYFKAGIVDRNVFGVHARPLPGAPLDGAGLPVPTVAVATAGGTSVIHPTGAVYDIGLGNGTPLRPHITADGDLIEQDIASEHGFRAGPIPYADLTMTAWQREYYTYSGGSSVYPKLPTAVATALAVFPNGDAAQGSQVALTQIARSKWNKADSMVSYTALAYATGWQPGDIRGAWLCDGATGNVTGTANLVSNGDFSGGLTGWTVTKAGTSDATVSNGQLSVTHDGTNVVSVEQAITCVVGQTYIFECEVISGGASVAVTQTANGGGAWHVNLGPNGAQKIVAQFTADRTTHYILFRKSTAGTFVVDNVSIKVALLDRSYKGKPLPVVGTLSRTAVATGADLVALSGFSAANYLEQPYVSDLDFGTGDFALPFWFKGTVGDQTFFERGNGVAGYGFLCRFDALGRIIWRSTNNGATLTNAVSANPYNDGVWHFAVALRRAGTLELWVDGLRVATIGEANSLSNLSAFFRIGLQIAGTLPLANGSLALLRATAYAPTPAQIAKMYRDELPLFQDGAKAFLGGTSASVWDLDVDTSRDVLVVGTGDGVSEFKGLRRVAYFDTASLPELSNDNMKAVASQAGFRLMAGGAQAVVQRDAVNGLDAMNRYGPRPPEKMIFRGVTTDATPTNLAPRILVGERERGTATINVMAREYGAAGTELGHYTLQCRFGRSAGGSVAGAAVVSTHLEQTASMDVSFVPDATPQSMAVQVTGVAGKRIVWTAEVVSLTRISEETSYAA